MVPSLCLAIVLSGINAISDDSIPEELLRIKSDHREKIEHVTRPVNEEYIRELERLKESFTRSGDLDGAVAIDRELHHARALGEWKWSSNGKVLTLWLRSDGTFSSSENDKIGSWTVSDGKLRFWDVVLSFDAGEWSGQREIDKSKAVLKRK